MSNYIDNIKKMSLLSVKQPDDEAWLRIIFRWYSKTFFTPLHQVEDLPLDFVLTAYFEDTFEKMEKEELSAEIRKAVEKPEDRLKREMQEEAEENEYMAIMREEVEKAKKKKEGLTKDIELPKEQPLKPVEPPAAPEEEIKVSFSDDVSFEELLERDNIPVKKQS